ncbi:MAG TPA: cytochrome c [Terriglobia bacterium]|nr:cytochrome c [Terriglobia bacterium]
MKKRDFSLLAFVIVTAASWAHSGNGQGSGALRSNRTIVRKAFVSTGAILSINDGTSLFGSKCAACHGKDGSGLPNWKSKGQPDLTRSEWQDSHTDEEIADTIKNGKGEFMPPFKDKLSDEEINAVVSRVRMFVKKK